jgi:hypothetical protein
VVHHNLSLQQLAKTVSVEDVADSSEVRSSLDLQKAFVHRPKLSQHQPDTLIDAIQRGAESWLDGAT